MITAELDAVTEAAWMLFCSLPPARRGELVTKFIRSLPDEDVEALLEQVQELVAGLPPGHRSEGSW